VPNLQIRGEQPQLLAEDKASRLGNAIRDLTYARWPFSQGIRPKLRRSDWRPNEP
jgi:hypothetical protein